MTEDSDYQPIAWKGHDFSDARRAYDAHAGRSYADAVNSGVRQEDLVPASITTNSPYPLILWTDETGSMGAWPATIFSKLPYLWHEVSTEYLGPETEILFGAVGDAYTDDYPLQAKAFSQEAELKNRLLELKIEGHGGFNDGETYELAALYTARNVHTPNAIKPIVIFIGDEPPYTVVPPDLAKKVAKVDLASRMTVEEVFGELKRRFSVYLIRKPYGDGTENARDATNDRIYNAWQRLLGDEYIVNLPDPNRVMDVIFGILAKEAGQIDYFKKELEDRQQPEQVDTVYESLKTVLAVPASIDRVQAVGRTVMLRPEGQEKGNASKRLT